MSVVKSTSRVRDGGPPQRRRPPAICSFPWSKSTRAEVSGITPSRAALQTLAATGDPSSDASSM